MSGLRLGELAELVGGELCGDGHIEIDGVAPLRQAAAGDLTWVSDSHHAGQLGDSDASAALVIPDVEFGSMPVVICARPDLALPKILEKLQPQAPHPTPGIDDTANLGRDLQIADNVSIGPQAVIQDEVSIGRGTVIHSGVFVGKGTAIGDNCVVWPNVVIRERTVIGHRVIIHPNATIGADGFGYTFEDGEFRKIPHIGYVHLEDDVEVGANACIDRGKWADTRIGRGTKVDNLVQIAHNVRIGEHCCIISQVGIAGSTELGHHVTLAGKVGVKDNIHIGNGVQAAACSCIAGNVKDGEVVLGTPAVSKVDFFKSRSALRRLPNLIQDMRELLKRVESLEATDDSKSS